MSSNKSSLQWGDEFIVREKLPLICVSDTIYSMKVLVHLHVNNLLEMNTWIYEAEPAVCCS